MKYDPIKNPNYVATVVRVEPADLFTLDGLDNLRGYTKFGMQALVAKDTAPGLYVLFSTEVQLAAEYAAANNLYREATLNADQAKTGYLEQNRRVKAIKLRGHRSESLLMPLDSLSYLLSARDFAKVTEGDVFDSINGHEVCRKYLVKEPKPGSGQQAKARVRRVDDRVFPQHIDSENYFRNADKVPADAHVTVSQKLHGTSVRYGNVPALAEQTWWERLLRRPRRTVHRFVVGSRRVVKSIDLSADEGKNHWYADGDLWTSYADRAKIADRIPRDHIVYGELVGFTDSGAPIQKDYTYAEEVGAQLYVYRVAVVTADGHTIDYSPAQMATFCEERGFKTVPVLWAGPHSEFKADHWLERRYYDDWVAGAHAFTETPVPLSDRKLVDEGVCIRYDGPHGTYIVKAKSPSFVRHESAMLDAGAEDVEADEAEEVAA
ncbi:MAG TPA: RNA ligase family protein [Phytomonospora sp.]